jgi:polysaccharide pyruvyl transferase WcaK-like protein
MKAEEMVQDARQGMGRMRHVHFLDTSVSSANRGDDIIVDCAKRQLMTVVGDAFISTSSSHDGPGRYSRRLLSRADLVFLLGSNALSASYRGSRFHWRVRWRDLPLLRGKVVLLGVGAHKRVEKVDWAQKTFLRYILSRDHLHSVRDRDAGRILEACGLDYLNTSCPTLWDYGDFPAVARRNSKSVCVTLTAGKPHASDLALLRILFATYEVVHFWPQQQDDLAYLLNLAGDSAIRCVPGNLAAYDAFLSRERPDYVGTRLHGGIRALSRGCRTLIISIDNRARAMGAEVGIPTIERDRIETDLAKHLGRDDAPSIIVDRGRIGTFLNQFRIAADATGRACGQVPAP